METNLTDSLEDLQLFNIIHNKILPSLEYAIDNTLPSIIITTDKRYACTITVEDEENKTHDIDIIYNPLIGFTETDDKDCPFIPVFDEDEENNLIQYNFRKKYNNEV